MNAPLDAILVQAALAQAAYADLETKPAGDFLIQQLKTKDGGFTEQSAVDFAKNWTVKVQFSGDKSGASATVFADSTGKTYLAIRGTEPSLTDFLADGLLALGVPAGLNPQFIALKGQIAAWMQGTDPVLSTCATT